GLYWMCAITERAVNQQRAQINVAAFADSPGRYFAAGALVARHHTQPGRYLPSILEALGIAHRGHERARGDGANAGNRLEPAAWLVVSVPQHDLALELPD